MRESLESSLELISNTVRASLSDKNIANTERLNRAVEILTRLSVLLMIPNSVFTLWPTLPVNNLDTFLGIQSAGWELLLALLLTVIGQVIISYYYKHSFLKALITRSDGAGKKGDGPAPPSQQT
jgi:Mg2+ and Co2+ transporter CorA